MRKTTSVNNAIKLIEAGETATGWSGSTDVASLGLSTTHKEGASALSFNKSGTTQAYGQISKTFLSTKPVNLSEYLGETLSMYLNVSSLTNIASVSIYLGTDATDNNQYTALDSELTTGWNKLMFDLESPDTVNGVGANLNDIRYLAVRVTFDAAANTLNSILVDSIVVESVDTTELSLNGAPISTENPLPTQPHDLNEVNDGVRSVKGYSDQSVLSQTSYVSSALEASGVVKNGSGNIYGGTVQVDSTLANGTYYILIMNASALPSNGAVTLLRDPIKFVHTNGIDTTIKEITDHEVLHGSSGIVIALSTTRFTLTVGGAYLSINAPKA